MKNCVKFGFSLALLLWTGPLCLGQVSERGFLDKRITLNLEKQAFGLVFRHLLVEHNVPIGLELSASDSKSKDFDFDANIPVLRKNEVVITDGRVRTPVTDETRLDGKNQRFSIEVENERLENVLNEIVRQMGKYRWEINNGVVNIVPTEGRNAVFERFLALKVRKFALKNPRVELIQPYLFFLPEVIEFMKANRLSFANSRTGRTSTLQRKLPSDLEFSDIGFRELLNEITKIKRGGWILKELDSTDPTIHYLEVEI